MKYICLVSLLYYVRILLAVDLLVDLPYGTIQGREAVSPANKTFRAFQGIPYAAPPVGSLRFQAPEPPANWSGVRSTIKDGNICYSVTVESADEDEDCLYINVYTPILTNSSSENLPVLLWIYGGAYRTGSSQYNNFGPDFLVEKDVVIVTFNYRIGPFGFLATEDEVVYGNAGLKDQVVAIKWVHDNIALFGGDPEQVTLFGQSVGGASVGYHLLYKKNQGLFRGAILQSGSPLSQFSIIGDISARAYAFDIATHINKTIDFKDNSTALLDYLLSVPAKEIDTASTKTKVTQRPKPVIEPEHDGAFLTKESFELIENGDFIRVPIMMGITSEEAISATHLDVLSDNLDKCEKNHSLLIPTNGFHVQNGTNASVVGDALYNLYFTNVSSENKIGYFLQSISDDRYKKPVIKHADLASWYTKVYFYRFSYDGPMGNFNITIQGAGKVGHGEDDKYIWKVKSDSYTNEDLSIFPASDVLTHKRIIELWTNFAKYLNPTPEPSELLQNITWSTVRPNDFKFLDIEENLTVKQNPRSPYYETWSKIYDYWNQRPFTVF